MGCVCWQYKSHLTQKQQIQNPHCSCGRYQRTKTGIRTVADQLSKQHTVAFVICNDLTAKMDVDVMNHMLVDGVGTFRPDILLILGGKDIYPRMLRKLKGR